MEANTKPHTWPNEKQQTPKLLHLQHGPGGVLCKVPWLLLPWSWGHASFPNSGYWSWVCSPGMCQVAAHPNLGRAGGDGAEETAQCRGDSSVPTRTVTMGTLGTEAIYSWL